MTGNEVFGVSCCLMRILLLALSALPLFGQANLDFLNHNRPVLDAHNCYPYKGDFRDRIDRALQTGFPVGIEQDLGWAIDPATGKGRPVVTHDAKTTGNEPALRDYFFERVRPIVEKALADNDRARWPIIVVHFDFKSVQPELLHAVWDLLGEYQGWITTAAQTADPHQLAAFEPKPLLVLTEDADAQEAVFFNQVPAGAKLRLFGSAHTKAIPANPKPEHDRLLATLPPEELLPAPPTNYRRWWNNSWWEVEAGRPAQCRRLDPAGRPPSARPGRLRAQTRLLDPLLHAGRFRRRRRQGLGQRLQLRHPRSRDRSAGRPPSPPAST